MTDREPTREEQDRIVEVEAEVRDNDRRSVPVLTDEELDSILYDLIVDHPMWLGDNGKPLEYHPEREFRIGRFLEAADALIAARVAAAKAEAWDEGHLAGTSDMVSVIGWGVDNMRGKAPDKTPNPFTARADQMEERT